MATQTRAARLRPAPTGRSAETLRGTRLAMLRAALAAEGYDGTVRLMHDGSGYVIGLSPEPGIHDERLQHAVSAQGMKDPDAMLAAAHHLADLARIAGRRADAIIAAGGDLRDPPAWSYLGHPVARAVYAAMELDMTAFRPGSATLPQECACRATPVGLRLRIVAQTLNRKGVTIKLDADQDVARIRVLGGKWPETLVSGLAHRPVGDILGLPGLERGTRAGDSPVGEVWSETDGIGFTVACALEPMGTVPDGTDTAFLRQWEERHYQ